MSNSAQIPYSISGRVFVTPNLTTSFCTALQNKKIATTLSLKNKFTYLSFKRYIRIIQYPGNTVIIFEHDAKKAYQLSRHELYKGLLDMIAFVTFSNHKISGTISIMDRYEAFEQFEITDKGIQAERGITDVCISDNSYIKFLSVVRVLKEHEASIDFTWLREFIRTYAQSPLQEVIVDSFPITTTTGEQS